MRDHAVLACLVVVRGHAKHAVQPKKQGQQQKTGDEKQPVPADGNQHGTLRLADCRIVHGCERLEPQPEDEKLSPAHGQSAVGGELRAVRAEKREKRVRCEQHGRPQQYGNNGGNHLAGERGLADPLILAGAVIVADHRGNGVIHAHDEHDRQVFHRLHHGNGRKSHVSAAGTQLQIRVTAQRLVHQNVVHKAQRLKDGGRQTKGCDARRRGGAERPHAQETGCAEAAHIILQAHQAAHNLADHRAESRALYAHVEGQHKHGVQHAVEQGAAHGDNHGIAGIPLRPDDRSQRQIHDGEELPEGGDF